MLDADEFRHALSLRGTGQGGLQEREFAPVLAEYERITGYCETNINTFYHHVTSRYGRRALDAANHSEVPARNSVMLVWSLYKELS